ncbi:MAG: DUF3579 domain-containing protein [Pseudomonadota bacterium]
MASQQIKWVIESVREDGRQFRPSDWIERISGLMGRFGRDHRLHYSDEVQPCMVNGTKCLMVAEKFREINPDGYNYIMAFARDNKLRVHEKP